MSGTNMLYGALSCAAIWTDSDLDGLDHGMILPIVLDGLNYCVIRSFVLYGQHHVIA